ncbi:S9 family peptidase [Dysgonomonas sp. 25]|uniref:S9 family peptidase n=1 Tax=Dysgonomonas sp. 25 TaxID=2302933 RepID=UPI0013D799EE|nr:S9 family peptidase [Dysgonomonas sp. 25]NDV68681.1 S9 family peptidase [Dysgonomonas sp. 25]
MKLIKTFIILSTIILFPMTIQSQDIPLTLEDLIPGGKNFAKYRPVTPRGLAWHGEELTYVKGDTMYIAPKKESEKAKPYLTLEQLNADMGLEGRERVQNLLYTMWLSPESNDLLVRTYNKTYIYNVETKAIRATYEVSRVLENYDFSPTHTYVSYNKENNLYMQDATGKEYTITDEKDKGIVSGRAVHRNEFGINTGTFWSPKGSLLAFYRMDETMVTDYPLVDVSTRIATLKNEKYPMAGMKSHHVTVGIYSPATLQTTYLKTGTPKEKYLTNIAWSPDEKLIYIAEVNRGQDTCVLKSYDVISGKLHKTLFTETHPKYVEPQQPPLFVKGKSETFIWQSRRDGYNHLYVYDTDGNMLKQLTSGAWEVLSVLGFDTKGDNLFYISNEPSPIEQHLYKVNLKSGKRTKLTKEEGVHHAALSASGRYAFDWYTSQYNPGKVAITDTRSDKTHIFHEAKNPYEKVELPEITLGSMKAADGTSDLYYRIVKPLNFDANKKYPTIVYVYGGPHSQLVDNSWMAQTRGWDIYMAEKGYVVFTMDNRGTNNRGADFEQATFRNLGIEETKDQMKGVEFLKSLSYVDADRIGVHGWSYGGFMTLNLMLRHPEVFKVGVAGGPVTDWKYYEVMYGERYMDTPKENPEGYAETSMIDRAGDLQGRLLLIHGDEDPTVVMQQSFMFIKSSIQKGTHPDFFVYPGQGHNMMGRDRVHLHEHITRYFEDHLK